LSPAAAMTSRARFALALGLGLLSLACVGFAPPNRPPLRSAPAVRRPATEPPAGAEGGEDPDPQDPASYPRMSDRDVAEYIDSLTMDDLKTSDEPPWDDLPEMEPLDDQPFTAEEEAKIKSGEWLPEWFGDWDGRDEPLDAPWRREAEGIIRDAVAMLDGAPLVVTDVFWDLAKLRVTVDRADDDDAQGAVTAEDTSRATRSIVAELDEVDPRLRILDRFDLEVTSPGAVADGVLATQRAFDAFKGFDVLVDTDNPISGVGRTLEGKLVEKTPTELHINKKGDIVRIPWHLVLQVRLPPALEETASGGVKGGGKKKKNNNKGR